MNFIIEHYIQLSIGLVLGLAVFVLAYSAQPRTVMVVLLLAIPFQPVETRYGSLNMVLTYAVFFVFLLKGRLREWPFVWAVIGIALAYLLSMSQVQSFLYKDHLFYVLVAGGNFALFYLVYNFFRQDGDVRFAMNVFLGITFLVSLHFGFSLFIGFEQFALFGVEELDLISNRESGRRLIGPFNGAEFSSDFLAIQILLIGYLLLFQDKIWKQLFLLLMAMACFGFLMATGSRGGLIALVPGGLLFLFLFRRNLGVKGLTKVGVVLGAFAVAATVVVTFSEFNVMLERLEDTHLAGFELDTRAGIFDFVSAKIAEKPMLGYGPRLIIPDTEIKMRLGYVPIGGSPHSLYLFLLLTIGAVGFIMYMMFFFLLVGRWWRWRRQQHDDPMIEGMPRFALVIMFVFLLTEYRIEFLRFVINDYQQYMFALWAMMLAFTGVRNRQIVSAVDRDLQGVQAGSKKTGGARILRPRRGPSV